MIDPPRYRPNHWKNIGYRVLWITGFIVLLPLGLIQLLGDFAGRILDRPTNVLLRWRNQPDNDRRAWLRNQDRIMREMAALNEVQRSEVKSIKERLAATSPEDWEAIGQDFSAVGGDIENAIRQFKKEAGE